MKAIEELKHEHQAIKLVLAIMQELRLRLETNRKVDPAHMEAILEFLTVFVDRCHHGKEEGSLFPALEAAGLPHDAGPIGVMLAEHDRGRAYVKEIADKWRRYLAGDKSVAGELSQAAAGYTQLLDAHILKEESTLFPLAEGMLAPAVQRKLEGEFERVEIEKIGEGKHEQFHRMLGELRKLYLQAEAGLQS